MSDPDSDTLTCKFYLDNAECHCTATGTVTGNYCNYSKVNNNTCECFAVGDTINIIAEASDEWHSKNSTSINNVIPNRAPTAPANLKLLINDAFNDTDHVITHNPLINWTNPLDDDGDALTIHAQVKEEGQSWQDDNSMNIQPADYSNEGMMTIGNSTLQDGKNYTFRLRACDAYSNCSGYAESNIWLRLNSNASINSDCTEPSPPFGNINLTVNITDPESDNIVWANFTVTKSKGTITSQNATTLNINNNSANHTLNLTYPSQTGNANLTIFYQNQKTHKLNSTQKSFNNETNATHHIQISSLINNATINITFSNLSNAENMTIYINSNQIDKIPNPQNITYNYSAALHPSQFNNFTYSLKNGTGTLDKTEITYYPNQSAELRINNNILGTIAFTNQTANSTFTNASQSWLANSTNITYTTGANITIFNCTINYSQTIPVTNNQNATQYGDLWKINFSTSADTTYSWSLVASDGFETSSLSNSFVTGNQNPLADGPFYSNIQNKHAFLAWSNATDADGTIISCKIHYGSNSEELLAQQNNTVNCSKEINTSHYSVNTEVAVYFVFKDDKQATKTTGIIYPIIPNQNPIITSLTLNNPHTYIDLITNWTFYDPEGDDTTQSIINWSRYGASYEVDQKNEYNLVSSNLEYTKTAKADNWSVCVKVKDQHNADSYINCTSNITIKNYPPQLTQIQNTTQAGHIIFISAIATDRDNETDFANCTIHYYNQHNASNKTGNLSTSYAGEQDPNQVKAKCAGNVTAGSWLFPNQNINITMQICDGNIPGGSNCTNTTMQTLMPNQMPQAILTTPPNRTNSTNSTIAFEWTSSDADKDNLTYNLTVYNSTGIFNCTDTTAQAQAITITSDGIYHWNVSATDLYNNTELNTTYSQARTITIDSTPPQLISAVCNITNISYNNAQNRTLNATQGDNITCTLEWSDNSQNWGIEGLANAALNITYSVKNNETENLNFTNNKTTFNLTNIPAGIIIFNTTAFDWLSNTNHSIINISANDTEAPAINTIYTSPSALADLDPNTTVTIYANITDNLAIHTALLYYHRNDSINTTNQTCVQMNKTNNIYNATLSNHQSGNWTYYIIANDTTGNTAQSQNYALQVWKDYTINVSINDVPANSIELNQNFTLGTITFNNTGDFNYTCDLSSSITSSKPMQFYYSSNSIELNPSDTSTRQINATGKEQGPLPNCKVNIQLPIDCTCLACTQSGADYINQIILYPEVEIRAAGPYFEDEITAPSSMQAGTSSTMHVKIRNIGTVNAENFSISFENMSSGISITGEATKSNPMLVQAGYPESFWRSFTISADADIYTDTYSFNIIANCTNCNSAQDIETVDIPIEGKTRTVIEKHYSGSSSGGSSSSYTSLIAPETITEEQKQKLFRTEATYELIRGGKQQFNLEVENPFEGDLLNVSVSITGFLSKYISVHPVFADRIHSGSSSNFTIFLEAPEYFKRGEYKLIFTIKGIINKTDEEINMKETRTITLIVLEISKQEAGHYIDQIKTIIEEMEDKNLNTKHLREFMETANASIRDRNYEKARDAYETIKKTSEHAFACVDTLNEMKKKQNEAIFNGIDIPKTKRLLLLAEAALNRGDYETAFKRAEDAKVTYALETVGVFNPFAFAVNNWQKLIAAFAAIMAMSYIGLLLLRCDFLNRKLKSLKKEENILLGLIRESQRECFEEGKMNMREYMQTLDQYEKQMSKAVQEIIKYETRRINLFKFFKKKSLILEEEKARLLDIIKDAQKIYLSAGNLDTRIYENRIKSYSERLVEVEEQLAAIKANDAMKKSSRILPVLLILLILPLPAFAVSDNSVHSAFILAEEGMDQMLEKGLPVTRYNDTLFLAKQIYEAQVALEEAGGSPDYSIAYSKLTELSQIKQKAFLALDELNALEATISQIEGIDKKPVREIHSKAKIEFEAERYEECLKSIDEAYEKISELEAIETKVKAFYEAGSRNIMGFLDKNRVQIVLFFSIMFLIIAVSYKRIVCWRIRNKMKALNARWYSIRALVAQTQREYFEDGKISETTYHIRIKKYGEMMRDIKRQIPLLNEELAIRMKKR
ncbi:MAG: hypothetical protein DRN66_01930 [Candidatus Nanohalarchaeota archaeon]|nr:MAG: hypothetical protein DRN66_01930 [Candidatus Nanohaloarchaeota archaeon]